MDRGGPRAPSACAWVLGPRARARVACAGAGRVTANVCVSMSACGAGAVGVPSWVVFRLRTLSVSARPG